ncbi:MAG: hypothetical protein WDM89_20935 [Rhizomicrobium sp.]
MIEQAARCRDQNVHAAVELAILIFERCATDQQRHRELVVLAVFLEALGHLRREFACRFQNERARHARLGAASRQQLDHWQRKARRLAVPVWAMPMMSLRFSTWGNALRLDRGRSGVTALLDRL